MNAAAVLNQKETYIGGELELQVMGEDGLPSEMLRGPITDIQPQGEELAFTFKWLASMKMGTGKWTLAENRPIKFHALSLNFGPIGNNRLFSTLPTGVVTIFPNGGSKLPPERVTPNPEAP